MVIHMALNKIKDRKTANIWRKMRIDLSIGPREGSKRKVAALSLFVNGAL
jgi:hypothetical protein